MKVAYVRYESGREQEPVVYLDPPFVPRVGDTVHLPVGNDHGLNDRPWRVMHVRWVPMEDQVEIGVS